MLLVVVRSALFLLLQFLLQLLVFSSAASADDDLRLRRTTPRADLQRTGDEVRLGIPGGRAWGVESPLRLVPRRAGAIAVDLEVADPEVREAFVRIAWYDQSVGRPRQIATDDSEFVTVGPSRRITLSLDPPEGAVAYRVRVLARFRGLAPTSRSDAVRFTQPRLLHSATPLTRLLPASP